MKNVLTVFSLVFGLFACQNAPKPADKPAVYTRFKFSEKAGVVGKNDPADWCNGHYGEAAPISADPKRIAHRIFVLDNTPARIVVDYGHMSAAFMLWKQGDAVEILTSSNLPACLSNKDNFQISPDGLTFRYDNHRDISFDASMQELAGGLQIAIDLPEGGEHGIAVVRCPECK